MLDLKNEIRTALLNNAELISLLQGPYVYAVVASQAHDSYITFFEFSNYDAAYADDQVYCSRLHYQIDIWTKDNPRLMAVAVDKTMKALGFTRSSGADFYEDDTKLHHKALRYAITKEVEGNA